MDESPVSLMAKLAGDPASHLLVGGAATEPVALERNPFHMGQEWFLTLAKPELPTQPTSTGPARIQAARCAEIVVPQGLRASDYTLMVIWVKNQKWTAILNDREVTEGSVIKDAVVVQIRNDGLSLRQQEDFPDGPVHGHPCLNNGIIPPESRLTGLFPPWIYRPWCILPHSLASHTRVHHENHPVMTWPRLCSPHSR